MLYDGSFAIHEWHFRLGSRFAHAALTYVQSATYNMKLCCCTLWLTLMLNFTWMSCVIMIFKCSHVDLYGDERKGGMPWASTYYFFQVVDAITFIIGAVDTVLLNRKQHTVFCCNNRQMHVCSYCCSELCIYVSNM